VNDIVARERAAARRLLLPLFLLLVTSVVASGAVSSARGTTAHRAGEATVVPAATSRGWTMPRHPTKVLVVIVENHSYTQMRTKMPYLATLSRRYGYARDWRAIRHPSLPNYLAIFGGSTFGVTNDDSPRKQARHIGRARSIFDQARAAHKTTATYAESMPEHCFGSTYPVHNPRYAVRHNPWTYFPAGRTGCDLRDVPLSHMAAAVRRNKLPNVGLVVPNLCHDAHDCALVEADGFLRRTLTPVLHSLDFRHGRLVVVVTADEDDGTSGNRVLTTVIASRIHGKVVTGRLTHYSLTRFMAGVLGVRAPRHAATAPRMGTRFGL